MTNTTRFSHTDCTHAATPAGRRYCRDSRRDQIRDAQKRYSDLADMPRTDDEIFALREYEATVDLFSMRWGMALRDAYELIENGPVIH